MSKKVVFLIFILIVMCLFTSACKKIDLDKPNQGKWKPVSVIPASILNMEKAPEPTQKPEAVLEYVDYVFDASGSLRGYLTDDKGYLCSTYRTVMEKAAHMYPNGKINVFATKDIRDGENKIVGMEIKEMLKGTDPRSFIEYATDKANYLEYNSDLGKLLGDVITGKNPEIKFTESNVVVVVSDLIFEEDYPKSEKKTSDAIAAIVNYINSQDNGMEYGFSLVGIEADYLFGDEFYKGVDHRAEGANKEVSVVLGEENKVSGDMITPQEPKPWKHPFYLLVFGERKMVYEYTQKIRNTIEGISSILPNDRIIMEYTTPDTDFSIAEKSLELSDMAKCFVEKDENGNDIYADPFLIFYHGEPDSFFVSEKVKGKELKKGYRNEYRKELSYIENTKKHNETKATALTDEEKSFIKENITLYRLYNEFANQDSSLYKDKAYIDIKLKIANSYDSKWLGSLQIDKDDVSLTIQAAVSSDTKNSPVEWTDTDSISEWDVLEFKAKEGIVTIRCYFNLDKLNKLKTTLYCIKAEVNLDVNESNVMGLVFNGEENKIDRWNLNWDTYISEMSESGGGRFSQLDKTPNLKLFRDNIKNQFFKSIQSRMRSDKADATVYFGLTLYPKVRSLANSIRAKDAEDNNAGTYGFSASAANKITNAFEAWANSSDK